MSKIKCIFVDIDWTIYDHKYKSFDYKSITALKYLQNKGVKIIVVTSRAYHTVEQLGLFKVFTPDGLAYSNGSYIELDGEDLYQYHFPRDILKQVVDVTKKHNLTMELIRKKDCFLIAEKNNYVDALFSRYLETVPPVVEYDNQDVVGALLFAGEEYDAILKKEYPKEVSCFRFDTYGVDIAIKKHDKGQAVKLVMNKLNLKKEDCMAFGDDLADISMFNEVLYPIALKNGKEETKKASVYVTKPVWKHGVFHALKRFKLLPKFSLFFFK